MSLLQLQLNLALSLQSWLDHCSVSSECFAVGYLLKRWQPWRSTCFLEWQCSVWWWTAGGRGLIKCSAIQWKWCTDCCWSWWWRAGSQWRWWLAGCSWLGAGRGGVNCFLSFLNYRKYIFHPLFIMWIPDQDFRGTILRLNPKTSNSVIASMMSSSIFFILMEVLIRGENIIELLYSVILESNGRMLLIYAVKIVNFWIMMSIMNG